MTENTDKINIGYNQKSETEDSLNMILMFLRKIKYVNSRWLRGIIYRKKFKSVGKSLRMGKNVIIKNPRFIEFGNDVNISKDALFLPLAEYKGKLYNPTIKIGNNVHIGIRNSFAAIDQVIIGNNVLFAGFVHITDHSHGYEDINKSISSQPLISKGPVIIEDECWLGFGCEILSGVTIGRHSIVGARAVVTKSIPPYSIVGGNPAKLIKQYSFETKKWERV